ncbi:hypothetical protein [Burkholderia sp. Ac-20353]|uniref:hypothetical protein n=1 Tax=Burkholderia sp. Ac-20353 TaxID=2703894 RepID=UPI00197BBDE2|nr:hypothetical protein [Burkholderia sp. Ac-20353]MBN3785666.1 hypothetical protein [Burkholderia sp. Ac-20353]
MFKSLSSNSADTVAATTRKAWLGAVGIAVLAVLLGCLNRYLGFAHPHHSTVRLAEVAAFGKWAPAAIEHFIGGFGLLSLLTLLVTPWNAATPRFRMLASAGLAVVYIVFSTIAQDGHAYLATHDSEQLAQIVADVLAIAAAMFWLARPASGPAVHTP